MESEKIVTQAEKSPSDLRGSILALIDTKTEYDMEQVIGKMSQMESRLESQMGQMKDLTQNQITQTQNQMQQMRWFIGGAIAISGVIIAIVGIIAAFIIKFF